MKELLSHKSLLNDLEQKEKSAKKNNAIIQEQLLETQEEYKNLESFIELNSSAGNIKPGEEQQIALKLQEINLLKSKIMTLIPQQYLSSYTRLLNAKQGVAIARVQGSSCGGCHMILTAQFINYLRRSPTIEQCPSCKRILVSQD